MIGGAVHTQHNGSSVIFSHAIVRHYCSTTPSPTVSPFLHMRQDKCGFESTNVKNAASAGRLKQFGKNTNPPNDVTA